MEDALSDKDGGCEILGENMTSIFNTFYASNVTRLNSSAERTQPKAEESKEGADKFARVLADVEKNAEKPVQKAEIAKPTEVRLQESVTQTSKRPESPITNLHKQETSPPTSSPPVLSSVEKGLDRQAAFIGPALATNSVNLAPETVKLTAPQAPIAAIQTREIAKPPSAPLFLSMDRIVDRENSQRVTPKLPNLNEIAENATEGIGLKPSVPKLLAAQRVQFDKMVRANLLPKNELERGTDDNPDEQGIRDIITTAGRFYGIDPNLGMAVANVESAFDPDAVSRDGHYSKGIFQLLDTTGKHMLNHSGMEEAYDPFDPAQNAYLGVGYLRKLHDIFSVETQLGGKMHTSPASSAEHLEKLAVAAFNAGEGNVARAQAKARASGQDPSDFSAVEPFLPASTRRYVRKVSELRQAYAQSDIPNQTNDETTKKVGTTSAIKLGRGELKIS